ncbi:ESPR-type extended signal peptide-containing protein [Veillonella rogosae]|uniref:ESPR-type extended signal peptide-containing protein n=1 Tax=Veillonella rogosae TaxID=423477 RepID=UPI002365FDE6|nr:ESPR-type extended signal peptide-containing protein [Veillonella rogosae]
MNKIFKVIWSKSKQCYIVVSEIAKNKTGKKKIVVASILAALTMTANIVTVEGAIPEGTRTDHLGLAIGTSSNSKSNQSIAIGYASSAQAPGANPENPATAVGAGANANGVGAVALGLSANATGANAVALGGGSNGGTNKTEATGTRATAISFNAKASGSDSIALGNATVASDEKAIAIGSDSKATDVGTTALGRSSAATGASATALGSLASATGTLATAVGMQASASGNESLAIGTTASATSGRSLAVGTNSKATGATAVAVGSGSGGSGPLGFAGSLNSTAGVVNTNRTVNYATTAEGDNAVALGFYANAKNSGVAVGQRALAATGGVAIGKGVLEDTGNNYAGGVVIGQDSATLGPYSLAMGFNAFASGSTSMAIGHTVSADGGFAVAMGRKVSASGTSTAIGHHATATNGGLAIGSQENDASNDRTTASAKGAVAIGKNTKATSEDAVAIGTNAQATRLNSVALGSGSTTATGATNQGSATINGITYNFAGATGNPNMQVSVGSTGATRQIKNVAAGEVSATSTDAINGSQLYAVASAVKPLKYVSINSTATGTGSNVDNDGAQAPNSIAIGPSSTVTKQNSIAFGNNAQSLSDDSITIGRNAKAEAGPAFTTTSRAIAIGANSKVATNVTQGIAIGSGSLTDEGAVVTGDQSIAIGGNVKVDGHAAVAIGGDDARKAAGQQVSYTNTNDNEVTGTLQTAIQNLTGYNLSNYKGTAASHAGVAYGTSALAGNAGVAIGTASDSMTRMNDKGQVVNNKPVTNAVAIGTGARANFDNSVAIGGGSNTDRYATKQVNAIIDGVEVKWSGGENISPGDVVSFGAKGFERQLKNVAPGEVSQTSTDAINGSQIYSLARKVTNIMNGGAGSLVNVNASGEPLTKVVTGTGANKQEKYYLTADVKDDGSLQPGAVAQTPKSLALVNVDEPNINQQTQTPRTLGNVANGVKDNDAVNVSQLKAATVKYFSVNSTDSGNRDNTGATGTNAIAIGPTAKSTGDNALAIGNNAQANSPYAVSLGHYANNGSTNSTNSVSIGFVAGGGSNGAGNVAIGSNAGKQVTGNNNISLGNTAGTVLNNNVYTSESILLGTGARVTGSTSSKSINSVIAIGKGAEGSATSATALGINANASAENAMALGPSSKATAYNGVALGSFSEANTAGGTAGYNANTSRTDKYAGLAGLALTANTGAVSIGSSTKTRQITNLAAGTNDTDAVNVAQLKSVNLAVKGNSGAGGDVNLATNPLTIKGNDNYITTSASGNTVNISGKVQNISVSNGTATAAVGMADAKNVAEAINNAVSQNAYTWNLTADSDTAGSRSTITKEGTVKFSGDQNITVKRNGNTITSSLNKSITVDSVKANNSVTTGSGSNQITLDGTTGAVAGKTFSGQSFTAGDNVLSNTTLQIGSPTNGNNVTITKDGLTSKAGTKTAKFGANGIDAGGQQIMNVSSGGNVGTNAANITDVKNAVSDVTLNLDTNSKTGTVKLSESPLKVIGANGIRTDLVGTNNGSLVIGLDQATVNATTKGIGLTGDTGSTGNKYLKDGDVSFAVTGDGNLVSTSATTAGVKVAVNAAKVKDLAVEAVTVSKDTQADNPITVTPTAGTNSKDYAIGIDTTKLASKTDLTYRANNDADANAQKVSLAKGLNFVNGDNTVATVAADGKVSYDLNAATKTKIDESATAVARNISLGADSGTSSSQSLKDGNVAFNVKGATGDYVSTKMNGNTVEVSTTRATIDSDANTGAASVTGNDGLATAKNVASAINSAVNGLSQNLNISDGTTDSTVALKNQKLTVTGTGAATATVNNQTITVNVAEGTLSNNADGTVKADVAGVATTKNVADVINKSISDNQYSWKLSANGEANTATIGKGDTVDFAGDTNITVDRNNKNISVSLNKNLTDMNSISLGNPRGETIFLNGRDGSIKASKAEFKDNVGAGSTITSDQLSFTNGATGANESTTTLALGALSIQSGPNSTALDSKYLMFSDEDGNNAEGSAKGMGFQNAAGKTVQFSLDEIKAGGNKIQEVAEGTADTDAVNVKQLKDTVASQTLTYRANTAADADAKSVKLSKGLDFVDGTSTVATVDNDGKVSFDLNTATKTKIDDSATAVARNISLGADSGTASSQSLKDGDVAFNVKGATGDYVSTNMNGNTVEVSTKRATINSDANTGAASVTGNDGLATAKNVADAINKAADAAKAGAAWNLTTNSSTTDKTSVQGGDTVDLINGDNILITQDGTDKKKITVATKKDLTVDSVTAGNTVINTSGLTNGTTAITGSGITTDKVTVGGISIDKTDGINAGGKAISNVASGGTTDTNAANIGDVKQAIANLSQNLNITDGTNNGTVDLKNQKLNVAGANGVTATVNNQTITVGLDANTVNATTKGIGLTADTGSTGNKYLKDGDVSFAVTGDGNLVSTSATVAGVKVAVDAAKVKDLAVDAVTVSKDAQADNPITVTPTAGTNSKDYAIGIDTTKLAAKTDLTYRANNDTDANAKKVSLAKGLNFVNGTLTTASIDNDGVVKYDVNTAAITAGTDGTVTGPTTDGVATAQNVADAINAAKKAAKTEITANTGEAANATTGNVTLTSTAAADGHTIYDVKLNDKVTLGTGANAVTIDGTAGKATVGTAVVDGVNNTITTGGASPVTLDGATGTITGKTANIGGVTVNGTTNDITGLSNTTVTGADFATKGRAATEEQLKAVTSATALKFTGDVATNTGSINLKNDTFGIKGDGKYISTDVNGKDVNLTVSEAEVKKSAVAAVTVSTDTTDANNPISVTPTTSADGTTKDYKVTIDGTKIANKTNLSYKANDGTAKQVSLADGLNFKNGTLTTASIDDAGVVKYDVNTAAITTGTDGTVTGPTTDGVATAQNIADAINAAKKAAKTEITANTGEAANATTGNVTLTSTTAADGHTIYDVKLNDKVTLGTGANAVTIDGTAGKITAKNAAIGGVTVDGDNSHVTGLSNTTWNGTATTGRAATEDQLKAVSDTAKATTDAVNLKFSGDTNTSAGVVNLKDDTFNIVGDGKYVTTDANGKDLTVKVSEAEVKKSAVAAVTVSTDTTDANNPISVTPTTSADGTTKDYKVTIDGTKIANKTNLSYKANDGTAKQVSLADGLNFKNGTLTTASIDDAGVVKYDVNTATITAGTDGTITGPTTDGVATAQNVADAINAAKKAAKTEITANTGEAANATTGNVTLTSTATADGHTIYDVKLNDKVTLGTGANAVTIDGTAGKATIGSSVVDGVNNTITTGGANAVSLDGAAGKATIGSSVVDGVNNTITTGGANAVSLDGAAGTVTGLTNKDWTPGVTKAVTGRAATEDQLQKVADAASSQTWNITADKAGTTGTQTGTKKNATVGKDQTVELVAGDNLTINQDERKFTYSLNKDLAGLTSVSVGTGTTETIKLDGATGKITAKNAAIGGVTVDGDNSHVTGLSNTTWNGTATTGRAATEDQLKAVADTAKATTDAVNLKFSGDTNTSAGVVNLKDDTFNIVGDGKYVTTDANGKDLTVKVSEAEVKKSAVSAVTVSTDTTDANNPISVTPTTSADGTTKDYKVTIDGTKIANKTNLSYKANDGTAKQVSLADGLNFKNGTLTTASIDDAGVVKYDVNTATITAGTDGTVTGPTTDGVATAQNVADAINAAKKAAKTEITANTGEAANATTGNMTLTSTTAADGHTIYDVKLNDKVTLGTGANAVTIDGTAGTVTGLTNKDWTPGVTKAVTGRAATEDQLQKVADAASSQTWNITADKAGTTGAQTGTKKNATVGKDQTVELVAGDNLTINQDERKFTYSLNKDLAGLTSVSVGDGTTETIKLDGATGKVTAKNAVIGGVTVDGDNSHVTGLSNTTWNGTATTGRAATEDQLKAVSDTAKATTDAVNLKFSGDTNTSAGVVNLKDDTFNIVGDGKYVTTDANGKDLTVKVSEAEVKKSAVSAVTVSTDTTDANNPISVTPTTSADGTTKDYKVTIDGTKIANKTNLSYKANDGTAKQVSLADGLNFKNGTLTTASIDDAGVVKYDVNTAAITAGTDGTVTGPTTDGVATAQNVADAINAAKKAAKTEITANTGEAANATTGNVTLTSTTAADGHTIYDVKLNDKVTLGTGANAVTIDGTAGKATVGTAVVDGVNNTITTGGANAVALDGAAGTVKTGTVTVTGGTTNDITGLSNTTVTAADFATKGRAATEEQLKAVGEQTWKITADKDATTSGAQTGTKKDAKVGKDDKVQLIAGENLTVNQNERDFTYSLNKDLVKMNSATFEATGGKTTVITGDSIAQTDGTKTNTSTAAGNTVADGGKSTATTADGTTVTNGADTTATTAAGTTVTNANGNTNYAADGVRINTTGKNPVSLTDAGLDNGNNVIKNVASGHVNNDDTDNTNAANIADVKKATTTVTANNGEVANATTGNVTLTSTTAADGHTIYDVKLNDKVTLGTGANAVTIDGTAGKATVGTAVVDGVNNTITTGGANAVALDGAAGTVKTGTVTVTGGTTNDITGLSNTTVTAADFATKGRAATEEQLKAVGEQTWQITADKDATTSGAQTGTKKDAKVGKDDKVQLIAGENLTVNQNERDFTYSLNKDLVKMNSATFEATGGKTTVITGDSIAQTDGTKTNRSTAAGNTVADGTKSTETTAAGQVIKDGAKTNTSTVDENTLVDGTKSNKTTVDSNVIDDGNGNVNTSNATSNTITDGTNTSTITAGKATIGSSVVDGVNNTFTTGGANAVKLDGAAGTVKTGTVTVTGGTTNDITGLSNTTVTAADFATKGRAATEEQLKAVGEQTWQITADKDATTSGNQTGTKKDAKVGKDDKVQLIAGENLTVNQNERDFTYSLNKDLVKMNSATFEATGGKTTVITGDSIAQTDGTKINRSTAAGNTVADGTKSTETTAAGQVIKDGAKTNTSTVDENTLVDGTKSNKTTVDSNVIDDGNGNVNTSNATSNTIANGANSTATTAAGTTVTNANGNTKYAADGVRINTTGKNPVSLTDAGLDNGNNVIKNVASGHVNNDDTDNTNAANIADVKKATTTVTANNGEAANATTGNVTLTSTTAADGHTIYDVKLNDKVTLGTGANAVTIDGTAGKATVGTAVVDGVNNTITTGGANAVALDGVAGTVKTGTVTLTGGTTNDITGLSNTTVNAADFATKGRAATEEQLKAVGEQTWQITADKDATTSGNQTGTKKDAKVGKDDKVQLIAGENLTVNQNERDFTYSLNKDLVKMNSATFEATGGKTTVITGDSIAQTDGTKTNRSTAAGNTVADGTKSTETTAAGQVIKDGAKTNTSTVDENTLVDGTKSNKTTVDSNVIDDGNGNVNTSKATSNTITDGTNTTEATASTVTVKDNAGNSTVITKDTITTGTGANKVTVDGTAGKVTAGSAVIDGVNNTITTGGANTVKLDGAAGTVTGLTNTAWTPGVTKAVSGRAATEDQLQQVSDAVGAGWNINSGTVAGSTGEANGSAKTKISSGEEVQLQAGNNLIIDQNGKTLAYSLNKNLKDMESAIFNATGGKTTVIKGDSIVQTDGGKTNTSNAAGNTVVDGTKSTATTAAGTTITDGAKTNTNTADKNVIDDGAGNTNTSNATSNTIADPNGNTNTATATSNTLADNAGNSNVSNATSNNLTDNAGNSNISDATSNTLKNAAGDETKVDAKGATVKDAAGNTTNVASTGATVTNAAGDTTKVEATGTTVADAAGNKATFTKDGVTITKPGKDTVSLTGNGLDNGNNKIVNVADGTNDTDAVNVRQLDAKTKAATTELTANGGESADNTTGNIVLTKTTAPDGHIIYDNKLNDKITLGAADPTKTITVDGTNGTIKAGKDGNAVAINGTDGTIKAGDGTNAVAIDGVNGSVKVADKIALNGKDGKAAIGTVGIDGKDGIITTGGNNPVAVNGKDGVVTGLTNKTWDPNNITSGRAATEDQVQSAVANAGWDATVGTEGSGVNSTPSATPEKIRPNETLTFKAGNNMMVSHAGKTISYAVNPELTDMKSATFKDAAGNTTVTNGNGITITPGSANPNNPNAGPVSLTKDGLNNGNNQIKGVAPGSDDTDAVNIGQLKASNAKMGDAIGQVAGEVQRVGAHAAAMAALKPIQYDPLEPTQIMAGVGNYRGETAAALGLAHYTNEDTMFNVGVSVGGNHNMVNAGVTHKFGSSPEKKNIPDRYKAGPISSVYVMQDEVSSLKKENAEQKYVIADQAARLNTLEAENERQRQELAETKQGLDDLRAAVDRLLASKG